MPMLRPAIRVKEPKLTESEKLTAKIKNGVRASLRKPMPAKSKYRE